MGDGRNVGIYQTKKPPPKGRPVSVMVGVPYGVNGIVVPNVWLTAEINESATSWWVSALGWTPSSVNRGPKVTAPPVGTPDRSGNGGMSPLITASISDGLISK